MYDAAVLLVVGSLVAGVTATAWLLARHDPPSSAFVFGVFLLVLTVWTGSHLGTLSSETLQWHLFFTQLSYVGVVTAPVAWFVFALDYTDRGERLSRRRLVLLSVVPLTSLALVFTAQHHALFYTSMEMTEVGGHAMLRVGIGPWHVVNVVYSYALLLAGSGLLVGAALSDNRLYRRQSVVLLTCVAVPWAVNVSYHAGVRPVPWIDPTPMAFIATGIPLAAVVVRTDLASYLPVAHERVFRTLEDPMLVVAPTGTVIDGNDAARTVLGRGEPVAGCPVGEVLPNALLDGGDLRDDLDGSDLRDDLDGPIEYALDRDGRTYQYLARRHPVDPDRGVSRGSVVALTDITARKERERELEALSERTRRKNEQLERMADVVAHDMRAPLSTAEKLLALLRADIEDPDESVEQSLDDLTSVLDRLDAFAEHIPRLARESTDVETVDSCDLERVARDAWDVVESGDVELVVEETSELDADRRRFVRVFENLFGNAVEHSSTSPRSQAPEDAVEHGRVAGDSPDAANVAGGGTGPAASSGPGASRQSTVAVTTVRVGTTPDGFYAEDDGPGIPPARRDDVFRYGVSSGDGSGFGLAIVRTVVEAHGWAITATESELGDGTGARFEVRTGE